MLVGVYPCAHVCTLIVMDITSDQAAIHDDADGAPPQPIQRDCGPELAAAEVSSAQMPDSDQVGIDVSLSREAALRALL